MNQPNLSTMTPKAAALPDSPDILAVVKRFALLLIGGAVLGAAASGGSYLFEARYHALYTAHIPFAVMAPPPPIGTENTGSATVMTTDDTTQVIHRQELLFSQETFLRRVMESKEFHPDDMPNHECAWLADHKSDPLYYLARDLKIEPRINAASFEITMKAHDAVEAQSLVQAAAKVYQNKLMEDSANRRTAFMRNLGDAVKKAEDSFQIKSDALADYQKRHGIDVLKSQFDIEKNALQSLNDDYTRADALASGAEQQYEALNKMKADGKEVALSSDLLQSIENDYTIKTLMNTRLQWQQERAAAMTSRTGAAAPGTTSSTAVAAIDARNKEIDDEIEKTRITLTNSARERMEKMLADEAVQKRFLANYIQKVRNEKKDIVTGIGQDLLVWQQRVDDLKEQGDLVSKLRSQFNLAQANQASDDTRVAPMISISDIAVPHIPSSPNWWIYLPIGTVAGLGLAALLAYLLVLTDTRVHTPRDISKTLQLPVLGFVPDEGDDRMLTGDVETAILSSPASMVAESFRQIRGHLTALTAHNPVNTMVVASVGPGGGATTVASNLAAALALNDLRVLLVDANFYRPNLNRVFKNLPKEGLTDAVADPATIDACIVPHASLARLHLMGAGTATAGASSEVFESKAFREVLENLKSKYDMVIFDGAPINVVNDSMALAARVDGVVPVVRAGEVSRGAVSRLRDQIRAVHGNLLGFVLNAAQTRNTGYFKENYRSFYKYAGKNLRAQA